MNMQQIRVKLRSQQGASILFALFFFIVCAVIGSIVLTAATAAAGRLSRVKEMDERYYAVTSAAQVVEKEINSAVVDISQETAQKWNGSDWESADSENFRIVFGRDAASDKKYSANQTDGIPSLLLAMTEEIPEEVPSTAPKEEKEDKLRTFTLDDHLSNVNVTVSFAMQPAQKRSMPYRSLLVTIQGVSTVGDKGSYSLTLKCPVHSDERTEYKEKSQWTEAGGGTKYRLKTDKEELTWSVAAVVKGAEK